MRGAFVAIDFGSRRSQHKHCTVTTEPQHDAYAGKQQIAVSLSSHPPGAPPLLKSRFYQFRKNSMGFNYAKEKKQFDKTWKKLQKEYEEAGMPPQNIESMRLYDWDEVCSRRSFENHTQPLPDTYLRTCIYNLNTPSGWAFFRHASFNFLAIHTSMPAKIGLAWRKIPRPSGIFGCKYRF